LPLRMGALTMAEHSTIEWTDATWNPITGCTLVSEGCRHCYAATLAATRLKHHPSREGLARINAAGEAKFTGKVRLNEQWLDQPLRWTRPRMIFVCAHGDLFHENVPDEWIDRVFAVMALCPQHTFQVLTKRPERAREYMQHLQAPIYWRDLAVASRKGRVALIGDMAFLRTHPTGPLPNVWLGTSIEDQATADERIPHLLATPAAVRFVSAEPLLGPVDLDTIWLPQPIGDVVKIDALTGHKYRYDGLGPMQRFSSGARLDWVIVGGESGKKARPMHPDWARSLRDQCQAAGVAFFFKQWGGWLPGQNDIHPNWDGRRVAHWQDGGWGHRDVSRQNYCTWDDAGTMRSGLVTDHDYFTVHRWAQRIGKKAAGRLLDGREWSEMPGVQQ